jgi:1A family penicillin-binding protein
MKERRRDYRRRNQFFLIGTVVLFIAAGSLLWAATLRIPDLSDISTNISNAQSTKIYDRTGQVLLYDMSQNMRRTIVPFDTISDNFKHAVLSIEDKNFYNHGGIDPKGIGRALLKDIRTLSFDQGGSTITQQVVKITILTSDKTPTRKIKEAILATKLEKIVSKDEILNIYLNAVPLGGQIYGVGEAAKSYYGKEPKDLTVAESAYLAAMIQAPTYYSPYGKHRDDLEGRKNTVLKEMLDNGYINEEAYNKAKSEVVTFKPRQNTGGIKAPHFVFFVIDYLEEKYGEDALQRGGLKVITTLDWKMQQKAEELAKTYGERNQKQFNASNNAIVIIDPKTGDILTMVGSRDYFEESIEGNYNVATSLRQPGSTIKPFVYATLFNKGFTPSSILFDVPTQFSVNCAANNFTSDNGCYSPKNFDSEFRGPMTIRNALALSINIPAVKALYIAGVKNSIETAKSMGITSLNEPDRYGLTLVLGGGEVTLLDMTSAYGVFANDGVRNPYRSILKVGDEGGATLEEGDVISTKVIPAETARSISSILSDNDAKAPEYGYQGSPFFFPGRQVAAKTGTTNDSRDAWVIGYTPNAVVGVWSGNNDNSPMVKKVAGLITAPLWHEVMAEVLSDIPNESFVPAPATNPDLKPVLRGDWQAEYALGGVHNILHWINKNDPTGPVPASPASDPQYSNWEYGVQSWLGSHPYTAPASNPLIPNYPIFPGTFPTQTTPTTQGQTQPTQTTPVQTTPTPPGDFGTPIYTPNQ